VENGGNGSAWFLQDDLRFGGQLNTGLARGRIEPQGPESVAWCPLVETRDEWSRPSGLKSGGPASVPGVKECWL
jgi:hypothetical protein